MDTWSEDAQAWFYIIQTRKVLRNGGGCRVGVVVVGGPFALLIRFIVDDGGTDAARDR